MADVRLELDRTLARRARVRRWSFDGGDARAERGFATTVHGGFEIAWLGQGGLRYRVDGATVDVRPGSAMLVPSGVDHASTFVGTMRGGSVHVDDTMVAAVVDACGRAAPVRAGVVDDAVGAVASLGALLADEMARDTREARLCADALAEALVLKVLCATPAPHTTARDVRVERAIALMRACFADDLGVDDLAAASGSSRFHFSRVFKAATGRSPHRYLQDVRLEAAAGFLRQGRPVTDAALSAGFHDLSRFAKGFRAKYGALPSTYRAESAGEAHSAP